MIQSKIFNTIVKIEYDRCTCIGSRLAHASGKVRCPTVTIIKSEYKSMNVLVERRPLGAVNVN